MPSGKARYNAPPTFTELIDSGAEDPKLIEFSDDQKQRLKSFYPDKNVESDPVWGDSADEFVDQLLFEAQDTVSFLQDSELWLTKEDLKAEQANLLKTLKSASDKLRRLSPGFDRLLGVDATPEACADELDKMITHVEATRDVIKKLPRKLRGAEIKHHFAIEMISRVLRVLEDYGIEIAATADLDLKYISDSVIILKIIGDVVGLGYSETTWRDIISKTRTEVANNQL